MCHESYCLAELTITDTCDALQRRGGGGGSGTRMKDWNSL